MDVSLQEHLTFKLKEMGYQVYRVNPKIKKVDRERGFASLVDVPEPIDIVDVFRKPMYLDEIVDAAMAVGAKAAGMNVVSNRCTRTEHERLQIPRKEKRIKLRSDDVL